MSDFLRKRLLEKYSSHLYGRWKIFGEDPNCDLGGYHSQPLLGEVNGTYVNIVDYALTLDGFVGYGSGGSIVLHDTTNDVIDIDIEFDRKRFDTLSKERDALWGRIEVIDNELSLWRTKAAIKK